VIERKGEGERGEASHRHHFSKFPETFPLGDKYKMPDIVHSGTLQPLPTAVFSMHLLIFN